jgi:hypothetical protein
LMRAHVSMVSAADLRCEVIMVAMDAVAFSERRKALTVNLLVWRPP